MLRELFLNLSGIFDISLRNRIWQRVRRLDKLASREAFEDSVRGYLGRVIDPSWWEEFLERLAGNLHRLREGRPIPTANTEDTDWLLLEIAKLKVAYKERDQGLLRGYQVEAFVHVGGRCRQRIQFFWSSSFLSFLMIKLGFSHRTASVMHARNKLEAVGCRLLAEVVWNQGRAKVSKIFCPGHALSHNRSLVKKRHRRGWSCPSSYQHDCWKCWRGISSCIAAVHAVDYEVGQCTGCGREDAWFDPDPRENNLYCLECQAKKDARLPLPMAVGSGTSSPRRTT